MPWPSRFPNSSRDYPRAESAAFRARPRPRAKTVPGTAFSRQLQAVAVPSAGGICDSGRRNALPPAPLSVRPAAAAKKLAVVRIFTSPSPRRRRGQLRPMWLVARTSTGLSTAEPDRGSAWGPEPCAMAAVPLSHAPFKSGHDGKEGSTPGGPGRLAGVIRTRRTANPGAAPASPIAKPDNSAIAPGLDPGPAARRWPSPASPTPGQPGSPDRQARGLRRSGQLHTVRESRLFNWSRRSPKESTA